MSTNISTTAHQARQHLLAQGGEVVTGEVLPVATGPVFSQEELEAIKVIADGGTVDGVDVGKLDHAVIVGLHQSLKSADAAMTNVAGFLGAALALRTWQRVVKADNSPYASEIDFIEAQIQSHPVMAQILKGKDVRRAVTAAITDATDEKGRRISDRHMASLLGVKKSVVNEDRNAGDASTVVTTTGDRGPQTGGQTVSDPTAVKRHVTGFSAAATRVRDDLQQMAPEQVLLVLEEARDTLSTVVAFAALQSGVELPDWAVAFSKSTYAFQCLKPKLRSGASGTVSTGPVLTGAPVDPTAAAVTPATAAARRAASKGKATA